MSSSVWLTSLSMTVSRSIHVAANDIISFFFYSWIIFQCMYIPHLLCLLLCWWTFRLLLHLGYCKQCWHEYSVQFSRSVISDSLHPMDCSMLGSLSITNSQSLLKLISIELVMSSNHLILHHPLLLLPSVFSRITVFSSESVLHIRWPKYWSFSFSIGPSNEYSGLFPFRINQFDLLPVQGTLKSFL